MQILHATVALIAAYLLGAIPFGYLLARARGIDIRAVGSGNIGATNVFRSVGRSWGILTLLLDAGKGVLAAGWIPMLYATGTAAALPAWSPPACALAAVAGHNWPVFLGFRGGKGVAVSVGVLLGLAPWIGLIGIAVWIAVFGITRFVSVASMTAAASIGIAAWFPAFAVRQNGLLPAFLSLLATVAILRHRANIRRLIDGGEPRVSFRRSR